MKATPAVASATAQQTKERWIKIAGDVVDKTPKECFERFRAISIRIKAAKS